MTLHAPDGPSNQPCPDVTHVRRIMFVCLGNICRSPLAQGVFEHLAQRRGVRAELTIESSGTGHWHIGDPPDHRSIKVARDHGVELRSRGQQLDPGHHFNTFDLILAMDQANLANIVRLGCPTPKAALFLAFAPWTSIQSHPHGKNLEVPDPYHGTLEDFEDVYQLVRLGSQALLDAIFPSK